MALGQLLVELGINAVNFHAGLDKATYAAKQFGNDLKQSFSQLGGGFSQLGAQLGASFGPLGGILSSVTQGLSAVGSAVKTAGSGVPAVLQLAGAAASIGGAALGAAAAFGALSVAGSKLQEELVLQSQKLGVTTSQMAALKYAAEFVNLPINALVRGFARFSKAVAESDAPTNKASARLHNLGVTAGTSTYDALQKAANGIHAMSNPIDQMRAAVDLFGARLGLQLLPLLKSSSYSFEAFAKMAKEAGVSVDANGVEAMERWKFATTGLGAAWDGLEIAFASQEWLTNTINGLKSAVEWATKLANKKNATQTNTGGYEAQYRESLEQPAAGRKLGEVDPALLAQAQAMDALVARNLAAEKAQTDELSKQHQVRNATVNALQDQVDKIQKGSKAAADLANAEKAVKETELEIAAVHEEVGKDINAVLAPMLQTLKTQAEKVEKLKEEKRVQDQINEAIRVLPQRTADFINEQNTRVVKAYASAIRALGPAYAAEAQEAEDAAAMEAERQKLLNNHTPPEEMAAALKKMAVAQKEANAAIAAFTAGEKASKMLNEYGDKMGDAAKKAHDAAGATNEIERAQASLDEGLDAAKRALDEEAAAIENGKKNGTLFGKALDDANAQLSANTQKLKDNKDALDADKQAISDRISAGAIEKQEQGLKKEEGYLDLLSKEPEWQAKATSSAKAEADAIGLKGTALKTFLDLKDKEAHVQHQTEIVKPVEAAVRKPTEDLSMYAAQTAYIKQQTAAWEGQGIAQETINKELQGIILKELELKSQSGNVTAGITASFLKWAQDMKPVGQQIGDLLVNAMERTNAAIAKTIIEGKSFGKAMRVVAQQMLEGFVEMCLQMLEKWIVTHIAMKIAAKLLGGGDGSDQSKDTAANVGMAQSEVGVAAAAAFAGKMVSSFGDIGAATEAAAIALVVGEGFASMAAFEQGGIVGHTGVAKLHENEMVLPRPISEKVQKMTDQDSAGRRGTVHVTYSPTVHAVDGKGIGDMLNKHGQQFTQYFTQEMRRRNMI